MIAYLSLVKHVERRQDSLAPMEYWRTYWTSRYGAILKPIRESYLFSEILRKYLPMDRKFSFLEIGGFPGLYSVLFRKYFGYQVTLLDYYIDREIIGRVFEANGVPQDVTIIESDFLEYRGKRKYDVVFSMGFIEHFRDVEFIIKKHAELTKAGGYIVIGLPNFLGFNGILQRLFDPSNLNVHNIEAMRLTRIRDIFRNQHIQTLHADYYGKFGLWLENSEQRSSALRLLIRGMNFLGTRLLAYKESEFFSPYILVIGKTSNLLKNGSR